MNQALLYQNPRDICCSNELCDCVCGSNCCVVWSLLSFCCMLSSEHLGIWHQLWCNDSCNRIGRVSIWKRVAGRGVVCRVRRGVEGSVLPRRGDTRCTRHKALNGLPGLSMVKMVILAQLSIFEQLFFSFIFFFLLNWGGFWRPLPST